ncbi:hypothetical protein [Occallatibacter savannae]|uniref:hypothetical protein n=1 Tax=Occallatibacter savannae TaxID=1002691 RepID=UPI000D69409F|nr:hypothetical protein [Occallatibacter savannae]
MSAEDQKNSEQDNARRNRQVDEQAREPDPLDGATVIPAIRHVGKTLESDPEYYAVATPGYSTPEAQIAAEAGPVDVDQRRMEEDDFDPLSGRTLEDRPEPLKTRLPGDTSSDPHTDVGPDNASNLQELPDVPSPAGSNRR